LQWLKLKIVLQNQLLRNCMNIKQNPVKDYRSVENTCYKTSHAVRYAACMLQYGCIPYGMQGLREIQFSTERYIPDGMFKFYNTVFNLIHLQSIKITLYLSHILLININSN